MIRLETVTLTRFGGRISHASHPLARQDDQCVHVMPSNRTGQGVENGQAARSCARSGNVTPLLLAAFLVCVGAHPMLAHGAASETRSATSTLDPARHDALGASGLPSATAGPEEHGVSQKAV